MSDNNSKYPEERCKTCMHKERCPDSYHCTCCQCMQHEIDHYSNEQNKLAIRSIFIIPKSKNQISGIYMIRIPFTKVLYIGQSNRIYDRMRRHYRNMEIYVGKENMKNIEWQILETPLREGTESKWINQFKRKDTGIYTVTNNTGGN